MGHFHFAIIFFDVLELDGQTLLQRPYRERREILHTLIRPIPGFSRIVDTTFVDLTPDLEEGLRQLHKAFAICHANRGEGLVLKRADAPYVGGILAHGSANGYIEPPPTAHPLTALLNPDAAAASEGMTAPSSWIKLKADYIPGLGDALDLCIIGASWNATRARELRVPTDTLVQFHLGALRRRDGAEKHAVHTWFSAQYGLGRQQLADINRWVDEGQIGIVKYTDWKRKQEDGSRRQHYRDPLTYTLCKDIKDTHPDVLFKTPLLAEVIGGGFCKERGSGRYHLRWPRLTKVWSPAANADRTWTEADELTNVMSIAKHCVRQLEDEAKWKEAYLLRAQRLCIVDKIDWRPHAVQHDKIHITLEESRQAAPPPEAAAGRLRGVGEKTLGKRRRVDELALALASGGSSAGGKKSGGGGVSVKLPRGLEIQRRPLGLSVSETDMRNALLPHLQEMLWQDAVQRSKAERPLRPLGKSASSTVVRFADELIGTGPGPSEMLSGSRISIDLTGPDDDDSVPTSAAPPARVVLADALAREAQALSMRSLLRGDRPAAVSVGKLDAPQVPVKAVHEPAPTTTGAKDAAMLMDDALLPSSRNALPPAAAAPTASVPQQPAPPPPRATAAPTPRLCESIFYLHGPHVARAQRAAAAASATTSTTFTTSASSSSPSSSQPQLPSSQSQLHAHPSMQAHAHAQAQAGLEAAALFRAGFPYRQTAMTVPTLLLALSLPASRSGSGISGSGSGSGGGPGGAGASAAEHAAVGSVGAATSTTAAGAPKGGSAERKKCGILFVDEQQHVLECERYPSATTINTGTTTTVVAVGGEAADDNNNEDSRAPRREETVLHQVLQARKSSGGASLLGNGNGNGSGSRSRRDRLIARSWSAPDLGLGAGSGGDAGASAPGGHRVQNKSERGKEETTPTPPTPLLVLLDWSALPRTIFAFDQCRLECAGAGAGAAEAGGAEREEAVAAAAADCRHFDLLFEMALRLPDEHDDHDDL